MLEKGFTVPELAEPVLPDSPSWFPLPPGWFALGGVVLLVILVFLIFRVARWRRNLWRRQALTALTQPQTVDSWLLLMKRILLVHQPREQVSGALDPAQWLPSVPLDNALRQRLCERYCQPDNQLSDADTARLRVQLRTWLEGLPHV
ncbi:DUF4381 domain-containing protein [Citrobacter portucalensis]|uniref:DUF4381 domain-containing protein n=1 Tax=Citrobacter portucalensis TaxID=1639133 RepID=A0AAW9EIX5_9ENTR|nr:MULTISPECIES: DUF4381 domain-containing protein [Citrobacter]AWV26933.1 hypothetical protein CD187_12165 [Citrobacter youngae]MBJ9321691.1 DUF4381 domain-containing protein [Citrobacter freundii]MBK2671655.1 DUF4381 domain-containing protein [Citrobacter freundii]MCQ9458392.1 DUF4381 domain-containing protein [Citrobacter portucalensis]MCS1421378.1 DUF4381 domain-containing protein [Citrobacter portucalensis]